MEGVPKDSAKEKADLIFKSLDTNGDGALDEMEFCAGCLNDPEFANMIQAGVDKLKTEQDFAQKMRKGNWNFPTIEEFTGINMAKILHLLRIYI